MKYPIFCLTKTTFQVSTDIQCYIRVDSLYKNHGIMITGGCCQFLTLKAHYKQNSICVFNLPHN